jgi:lipopolysaccharide transport system permease protein
MEKTIIDANSRSILPDFREIYKYRQLLFSLAWRDVRVKYAQTYIGFLWALINPIVNLAILGFVFGKIATVNTQGVPHLLFTAAGLVTWTYFSTLISQAGSSIVAAQAMIKKIYFPRLIIPASKAISGLIDFVIILICLVILMIYYEVPPSSNVIFLPFFIVVIIVAGLGGGILISALTSRYRDFSFIVPLLTRLGMFITPIGYSSSSVPEEWKYLYFLNPLAGVVEGFRWCLFDHTTLEPYMLYSISLVFILLAIGLLYFNKVDRVMADIL